MNTLQEQFENITKMRLFEIETSTQGDYEIFEISADDTGLCSGSLFVEWDNVFSLDAHLQALYEICIYDMIERGIL